MKKKHKASKASAAKKAEPKQTRRKKKRLRKFVAVLLILLVLSALAYAAARKLTDDYTVNYQAYSVTTGTISNSLSFNGTLQVVDNQTYTATSDGTIRTLYVEKGTDVKKGDLLLRFNSGRSIKADFDGRINQLYVSEGASVSQGDSLLQLVDFEHMRVSIRVDEYDISDVKVGDECRITTTATEDTFSSVIDDINYVSSSTGSVAYYTATAYVDVEGSVYPGMQVTVSIPQDEATDVVILKEDALSFDRTNQAFVYMLEEDGSLSTVYVKTGVSNGNYVEIKEGLKSGDTVYVEVKAEESSSNGLFSYLFGGTNIMGGRQNTRSTQSGSGGSFSGAPGFGGSNGFGGSSGFGSGRSGTSGSSGGGR